MTFKALPTFVNAAMALSKCSFVCAADNCTRIRAVSDPSGITAGKMDVWSLGLNWWLTPRMNANINYRYIDLDRFGVEGTSQGFVSRIMLILE